MKKESDSELDMSSGVHRMSENELQSFRISEGQLGIEVESVVRFD